MRLWIFLLAALALTAAVHWQVMSAERSSAALGILRPPRFPGQLVDWLAVSELSLDPAVERAIAADHVVTRRYLHVPSGRLAEVFIGYFASAAPGILDDREPHLPTVCLPAAGWTIVHQRERLGAVELEVSNGTERRAVAFWHQTPQRVLTNPLWLRWHGPWERWKTGRNDFVLARIVVPEMEPTLVPALMAGIGKWMTELPLEGGRK
jgi:EpsI family protein